MVLISTKKKNLHKYSRRSKGSKSRIRTQKAGSQSTNVFQTMRNKKIKRTLSESNLSGLSLNVSPENFKGLTKDQKMAILEKQKAKIRSIKRNTSRKQRLLARDKRKLSQSRKKLKSKQKEEKEKREKEEEDKKKKEKEQEKEDKNKKDEEKKKEEQTKTLQSIAQPGVTGYQDQSQMYGNQMVQGYPMKQGMVTGMVSNFETMGLQIAPSITPLEEVDDKKLELMISIFDAFDGNDYEQTSRLMLGDDVFMNFKTSYQKLKSMVTSIYDINKKVLDNQIAAITKKKKEEAEKQLKKVEKVAQRQLRLERLRLNAAQASEAIGRDGSGKPKTIGNVDKPAVTFSKEVTVIQEKVLPANVLARQQNSPKEFAIEQILKIIINYTPLFIFSKETSYFKQPIAVSGLEKDDLKKFSDRSPLVIKLKPKTIPKCKFFKQQIPSGKTRDQNIKEMDLIFISDFTAKSSGLGNNFISFSNNNLLIAASSSEYIQINSTNFNTLGLSPEDISRITIGNMELINSYNIIFNQKEKIVVIFGNLNNESTKRLNFSYLGEILKNKFSVILALQLNTNQSDGEGEGSPSPSQAIDQLPLDKYSDNFDIFDVKDIVTIDMAILSLNMDSEDRKFYFVQDDLEQKYLTSIEKSSLDQKPYGEHGEGSFSNPFKTKEPLDENQVESVYAGELDSANIDPSVNQFLENLENIKKSNQGGGYNPNKLIEGIDESVAEIEAVEKHDPSNEFVVDNSQKLFATQSGTDCAKHAIENALQMKITFDDKLDCSGGGANGAGIVTYLKDNKITFGIDEIEAITTKNWSAFNKKESAEAFDNVIACIFLIRFKTDTQPTNHFVALRYDKYSIADNTQKAVIIDSYSPDNLGKDPGDKAVGTFIRISVEIMDKILQHDRFKNNCVQNFEEGKTQPFPPVGDDTDPFLILIKKYDDKSSIGSTNYWGSLGQNNTGVQNMGTSKSRAKLKKQLANEVVGIPTREEKIIIHRREWGVLKQTYIFTEEQIQIQEKWLAYLEENTEWNLEKLDTIIKQYIGTNALKIDEKYIKKQFDDLSFPLRDVGGEYLGPTDLY